MVYNELGGKRCGYCGSMIWNTGINRRNKFCSQDCLILGRDKNNSGIIRYNATKVKQTNFPHKTLPITLIIK
jgi:hypothetical protein